MEGHGATETSDRKRPAWIEAGAIALLALTLNLLGNARTSLWDRDEPRYAGATREMRASGDLVHPTFNAEPRYHKPILIYWLMLGGTAVGGDNTFGVRLISALSGVGTVLLVWGLGRRMFGPLAGRLAGIVLATAPIMVVESKLATTDAALMLFLTVSQFALWELSKKPSGWWAATFWVSLSLATLTKGPVGPALIAASAAVSILLGGPREWFGRLRWGWGLLGFTAITAPWYVAIGLITDGEFYRVSMGKHVIHRMTTGMETHGGFPGYYVALSMATFYPWSALLPAGLAAAWSRRRSDPAIGFVVGWIVGPLVMLELVRTKLIHYYLPSYAGWALLAAWIVVEVARSGVNLRRWALGRLTIGLFVGIGLTMAIGLTAGATLAGGGLRYACLATALAIGAGTLWAFDRLHRGETLRSAAAMAGTWAVALGLTGAWLLPSLEPLRLSPRLAEALRRETGGGEASPMLASYQAPAVVYHYGEPIPILDDRKGLSARLESGPVVVALTEAEAAILGRDPGFVLEARGEVEGIDVERAKFRTLRLYRIREATTRPAAIANSGEQSFIK